MHPLTFQLKRAHLQSVAFGLSAVKGVEGMTPARFDLMFVIRTGPFGWPLLPWCTQMQIRDGLGVSGATVSKMIKRLREMGWLESERNPDDGRQQLVSLTEKGLEAINRAIELVFGGRTHMDHFEEAFASWVPDVPPLTSIKKCWSFVNCIAHRFKDTAQHLYELVYPRPPFVVPEGVDELYAMDEYELFDEPSAHDDEFPYEPPPKGACFELYGVGP